jgi:hypothetical protein
VQVAFRAHGQVEARVTGQAIEHVIEKADARGYIAATGAIDVERDLDAALTSLAFDVSCARRVLHSSDGW